MIDLYIILTTYLQEGFRTGLESTVGIAKLGTKSLRATVPEGIVAFLEIKEGDKLEWKMELDKDGNRVATVVRKEVK
jgi:hypothetical protein